MPAIVDLIDLDLAWKRTRADVLSGRTFVRHPLELELIEVDTPSWLELVRRDLTEGRYAPGGLVVAPIPKGLGLVRPGGILSLWDHLVYAAAVGAALPFIRRAIEHDGPPIEFSHHLSPADNAVEWIASPFRGWRAFREQNLARVSADRGWVVKGDLVGCYENIALRTLASDLRAIGVPDEIVVLLSQCLRRWAQVTGRGVPQSFSASDILAKLYLNRVDRAFSELGFSHHRYVDDFVIFCDSKARAKEALIALTGILRKRGLAVQGGKTSILAFEEARAEIDQVTTILQPLASRFVREIAEAAGRDPGYLTLRDAERLVAERMDRAPIALIRDAYELHCVRGASRINRSLFHYLLNRLGNARDRSALEHSISLLEEYPEETAAILAYVARVSDVVEVEPPLLSFLSSANNVYKYQQYQIISWGTGFDTVPTTPFVNYVRAMMHRTEVPYLRAVARMFLGKFGTVADLDSLEDQYDTATSPLEKAEIIGSLGRLELSRRNALLSTARADGEYPRRAARLVGARRSQASGLRVAS